MIRSSANGWPKPIRTPPWRPSPRRQASSQNAMRHPGRWRSAAPNNKHASKCDQSCSAGQVSSRRTATTFPPCLFFHRSLSAPTPGSVSAERPPSEAPSSQLRSACLFAAGTRPVGLPLCAVAALASAADSPEAPGELVGQETALIAVTLAGAASPPIAATGSRVYGRANRCGWRGTVTGPRALPGRRLWIQTR